MAATASDRLGDVNGPVATMTGSRTSPTIDKSTTSCRSIVTNADDSNAAVTPSANRVRSTARAAVSGIAFIAGTSDSRDNSVSVNAP